MGRVYVSDETRNTFSMSNFFGQYKIPERVMLLEEPEDAFFHRINLISKAQEQILLATYVFSRGISGDIVAGALLHAADRGVNVKIINDGLTGIMPSRYRNILAAHDNIDVYLFNRFEFFRPQYHNTALHDKYMTVDNSFMILGGRNIGDRFFNPEGFTGSITLDRDVLVYNSDTNFNGAIADVRQYFNLKANSDRASLLGNVNKGRDWEERKNHFIDLYIEFRDGSARDFDYKYNTVGVNRITLITNPTCTAKKESVLAYNLMMMIKNSDVIIAQSPYLVLTARNLETFAQMVEGRTFILSTNSLASTTNLPAFSAYYTNRRNILATGITIYEFQDANLSLHSKTYLFDGRLTAIGSFNMNERSIRSDTESMLIIDSEEFFYITLEAISRQVSNSLRLTADNGYVFSNYVDEASVSFARQALYMVVGYLLRPLRFMF